MDLTGIQNIGEFYSHHYLDALLENDLKGLFAKWREGDETTPDRRLYRLATDFFKTKSLARPELDIQSRYEPSHRIHVELMEALGYSYSFNLRYIDGKLAIPILSAMIRDGHEYIWLVETPFPGHDKLMEEDTSPFDQCLFRQQYPQTEEEFFVPESRWEDLIGDIFHTDEPPRWLVLFAGRFIYLIDRTKWGRGQYLLFDLDEILGRRQTQTLRATAALLSREALCPADGVPLHDTLDENSHKHAYGVSSDLKYGLRRAVELLANEYVWYQRTVAKQALFQDEDLARKLTDETLTYLYRLLFLLYAEARGSELDVVPVKAESYLKGYSLEALRDLEQVPLTTPLAQNGYYLNESLNRLFTLVDDGYKPQQLSLISEVSTPVTGYQDYGFTIDGLHSPLFNRQSTPLLSSVRFRNSVLQEVIQLLSLSKEKNSKKYQRGRISYAQLGINQLGAVYEGLLSYSGFFADERLYEVKPADSKDADEIAQTYFIPESELERYLPEEFVYNSDTGQRKGYEKGTFIFRLAGRDREKSASYYTPEVLTQCTVKYSLKELLKDKSADDILKILLLEPAMGSGAFANESLNQLADAYLERKQKELGKRIPADDYRTERQKVKYYLAVNNTYGVDLNPTAVELARVSLWLNIMYPNSPTPWFGARLATGNSLIGARRQVYSSEDVKSGAFASKAPEACPMHAGENGDGKMCPRPEGSIYHWLLPDAGMAAFDNDKVIKELAPAESAAIKKWRKDFNKPFTAAEIKNMIALSDRADELWQKVLDERLTFLEKTRQPLEVWGQPKPDNIKAISIQQCERELDWLRRPTGPYARLKLAMDYWCALWFWPIPEAGKLPARQQFLDDMAEIFTAGEDSGFEKEPEQMGLFASPEKPKQARLADLKPITIDELLNEPRLDMVSNIAIRQRFHHWELVFSEVFSVNSGFDLILGNPPWVSVAFDQGGVLSDYDARIALRKFTASEVFEITLSMMKQSKILDSYFIEFTEQTGIKDYLGALCNYSLQAGKVNLYKLFVVRSWELGSKKGISGFLHPEGIYDDPKIGLMREQVYRRLRLHFQFHNELNLFAEPDHHLKYSVNIYQTASKSEIEFFYMANLFHPATIDQSYLHDGSGAIPSIRNEQDKWEIQGHRKRIIKVRHQELLLFSKVFDDAELPAEQARLPLIHTQQIVDVLEKFANQTRKFSDLSQYFYLTPTTFWNETTAQKDGYLQKKTQYPQKMEEWVISGPHFHVATPLNKTPNENCSSNLDYTDIDLTTMATNFIPRANFVVSCSKEMFYSRTPVWKDNKITTYYRQAFRAMLASTGERTLIGCIIPPEVTHVNGVQSYSFTDKEKLVDFSGLSSSLLYDFFIKITGKQNLHELVNLLPVPELLSTLRLCLRSRILRLNSVSVYYSDLWQNQYNIIFKSDVWSKTDDRLSNWSILEEDWTQSTPLKNHFERRQALVEVDVLVALALGLTLDELIAIYRVQFPVLQKNEHRLFFDQRGMEVPMKTISGELGVDESHPKFPEMVPPFTPVDREEDYRVAWKFFEEKLREKEGEIK